MEHPYFSGVAIKDSVFYAHVGDVDTVVSNANPSTKMAVVHVSDYERGILLVALEISDCNPAPC